MNFHYEIFPEKKGVLMTMEGYFSLQDLMNSIDRFWNDPQYDRDFNGLIDLTSPSLGVSLDDIRTLFHFIQQDKRTSRANWAVVASTPLAFACAMFYSKLMEKRHVLEVFSTWDAACTFIGMDFPHKNLPPPIRSDLV